MISFDTDGLMPHERFDHWCEVRAKGLFGVTIEVPRERRPEFYGRFSAREFGGAVVAEMQAASYHVRRSWSDIRRVPSDSLYIAQQVRGPGALHTGDDRIHAVTNGSLVISHSDLPFAGTPQRTDGFHFRAIKIPVGGNEWLAKGTQNLLAEPLAHNDWMTRLIGASFAAITAKQVEAPAETAIRHLAQLALLARGRVAPGSHESRSALRHGYLHEALRLMAQSLARPELSPGLIAGTLNISLRQLHLLFEPTGMSFSRTLLSMRLAEARRQLESMPLRPIGEIGTACGFDSIATFYRTFGRAYGMAPGDLRKSSLRR